MAVDAFVRSVAPIRLLTATTRSRSSSSGATNKMMTTLSAMQQQQPQQLQQCNTSFVSYLDSLAHSVKSESDTRQKTNVIIGNEAGDADSIISALTLGYVMSSSCDNNTKLLKQQHVPVVSISRAEMELRRDAAILLDLVGIDIQKLLYLDDDIVTDNLLMPPASALTSEEDDDSDVSSLSITLVDHNRLRHMFSHLNPYVTEIIDHHQDEGYHGHVVADDSGKRNIAFANGHATVASTCTLVAERLFETMPAAAAADANAEVSDSIDGALGLSLLGVILLDSINMSPEAKKGTPRDEEAIQQLLKCTDWTSLAESTPSLVDNATIAKIFPNGESNMPDRKALFETLISAKSDPKFWSDMSAMNCLRVDYKKFIVDKSISIGLSSVIITMDDLLTKEGFIDSMKSFIASEGVTLFGVLGVTFDSGKPTRELLLAGNDDNVVDSFSQFLLEHPDAAAMEIVEREDCSDIDTSQDSMRVRVFRQGNAKGSRKQIAPLLLQHASTI